MGIILSPRPTGEKAFALKYPLGTDILGDDLDDENNIPEIVATDYYHTAELLDVVSCLVALDEGTTIDSQLIQDKVVIEESGEEIPAAYTQILTLPNAIDKNKFNQVLQLLVDNKLIHDYEKTILLIKYENEHPTPKPKKLRADELFRQSLDHIQTQIGVLRATGDYGAADAARALSNELNSAYDSFNAAMGKMPFIATEAERKVPAEIFQERCDKAIAKAKETLGNYWDLQTFFLNLAFAVVTLGIGHSAVAAYNYKQGNNQGNPLILFKPYSDGAVEDQLNLEELSTHSKNNFNSN